MARRVPDAARPVGGIVAAGVVAAAEADAVVLVVTVAGVVVGVTVAGVTVIVMAGRLTGRGGSGQRQAKNTRGQAKKYPLHDTLLISTDGWVLEKLEKEGFAA